ncbi:hypothetical protein C8J56DRAFT_886707 [Mycena floridula]|nr:hypothetical protein C8J56DRAFT_886707 [Mycena floridula]
MEASSNTLGRVTTIFAKNSYEDDPKQNPAHHHDQIDHCDAKTDSKHRHDQKDPGDASKKGRVDYHGYDGKSECYDEKNHDCCHDNHESEWQPGCPVESEKHLLAENDQRQISRDSRGQSTLGWSNWIKGGSMGRIGGLHWYISIILIKVSQGTYQSTGTAMETTTTTSMCEITVTRIIGGSAMRITMSMTPGCSTKGATR